MSSKPFDAAVRSPEPLDAALPLREDIEVHSIISAVGPVRGRSVLDMGCGTGLYSRRLAKLGAGPVVGCDHSELLLDYARDQERLDPLGVRYLCRDVGRHGPAPDPDLDGRFDVVIAAYVLPYARTMPELVSFCRTAHRALRPGGQFVVTVINPEFCREPGRYEPYGFTLTCAEDDCADGRLLTLTGRERPIVLYAHYWSAAAYSVALREAGFGDVAWAALRVTRQARRTCGKRYWRDYLARPHLSIIDARV